MIRLSEHVLQGISKKVICFIKVVLSVFAGLCPDKKLPTISSSVGQPFHVALGAISSFWFVTDLLFFVALLRHTGTVIKQKRQFIKFYWLRFRI